MTAAAAPKPRPYLWALFLGLLSEALFLYRLTVPHKLVFDEVHYVPAARTMLTLAQPVNIEHPLLAKAIIAAGIATFGDDSFGWRFFSTLAGVAVVLGVFAIMWLLFHRVRPAVLAALFTLVNFTVFIQARIAMLDGFMAAFVVLAIAAILWAMRGPGHVKAKLALAAVLLGLGAGCKWNAVPYLAYAGLAFFVIRIRDARRTGRDLESVLYARGQAHWPNTPALPAMLILGCVSIIAYLVTFLPAFFYHMDPLTLHTLLPFQLRMYHQQTQVLPPHPYQSSWWTWPLLIRPIWYLYEPADGAVRGILMIGNPAIMWGGLIAIGYLIYAWWRSGDARLIGVAGLWIGSYAIWIVIPKSLGFFYYYYLPSIFLGPAIAAAFDHLERKREHQRRWDEYFLIVAIGLFAYFFPILSAAPLGGPQSFHNWMWFPTWP